MKLIAHPIILILNINYESEKKTKKDTAGN